jgi:hypothetical protein
MVAENFDFYLKDAGTVDVDAPLQYNTDFLVIPTDSPVLSRIETDRRWEQVFRDGDAALFARIGAAHGSRQSTFPLPASSCSAVLR